MVAPVETMPFFRIVLACVIIIMTTSSSLRLSVILPAYNEEFRILRTLCQSIEYLKSQPYSSEIIVVDDGSKDRTCEVVRNHCSSTVPVALLSHPDGANHGKGASIKYGMLKARGEYRLFMDADNSTTLEQIASFWPHFDRGSDVVIGSRALKESVIGKHQARYKELAGRAGNWLIRSLAAPGIRDTQAGFKMFAGEMADRVFPKLTIDRWGADIEMIVIARLLGCKINEVPITWLNASGSKVTMASYLQVFSEVLRIRRNIRAGIYK
jgi:dolichyl-phosphate beta-glucosyltransferase